MEMLYQLLFPVSSFPPTCSAHSDLDLTPLTN